MREWMVWVSGQVENPKAVELSGKDPEVRRSGKELAYSSPNTDDRMWRGLRCSRIRATIQTQEDGTVQWVTCWALRMYLTLGEERAVSPRKERDAPAVRVWDVETAQAGAVLTGRLHQKVLRGAPTQPWAQAAPLVTTNLKAYVEICKHQALFSVF